MDIGQSVTRGLLHCGHGTYSFHTRASCQVEVCVCVSPHPQGASRFFFLVNLCELELCVKWFRQENNDSGSIDGEGQMYLLPVEVVREMGEVELKA